jgi:hypothetical protein
MNMSFLFWKAATGPVAIVSWPHRVPSHPPPLPLHVTAGKNHLNPEEITPLISTGIGERFSQTIIKFRTCSALAPKWTPPLNESADLTQGTL